MNTDQHAERFSQAAHGYTTDRLPVRSQCIQKVLQLLDPRKEDVVLDFGCGPGIQLIDLSPLIKLGIGVDPAEGMIYRARADANECNNLHFYKGSAEQFPEAIRLTGVNKIYSNYVIHHLPNEAKQQVIQAFSELLPEGGSFILGDMMFSDDPENHRDFYGPVGYVPINDSPATITELEVMFEAANLTVTKYIFNPLAGVIIGVKT